MRFRFRFVLATALSFAYLLAGSSIPAKAQPASSNEFNGEQRSSAGWRVPRPVAQRSPVDSWQPSGQGGSGRPSPRSVSHAVVEKAGIGYNFRQQSPADVRAASAPRRNARQTALWQSPAPTVPPPPAQPTAADAVPSDELSHDPPAGEYFGECETCPHTLQFLPNGLMYKSYLAGEKEPRFASVWLYEEGRGWVWETTIGARIGLLRYGTAGPIHPQGWQIDVEGAVFPRIDPDERSEMDSVDFRAGMIWTWRRGPLAVKAGYYHISSHIGDEYLLTHPAFSRIEYVRDSTIAGVTYNLTDDLSAYGEVGYAVGHLGGAQPWEFQFGLQYSPACPRGHWGAPFAAVNGHLREDFDYGGNVTVMAGRQWRSAESDRLFRAGLMYFNGKSLQYQFFDKDEELLGLGMWLDF